MAQDYRDLVIWQKAIELSVAIYKISFTMSKDDVYGLSSQMRRGSVSIAGNIHTLNSAAGKNKLAARS